MQKRHLPALAAIDAVPALAYRVRSYFDLPAGPLISTLLPYSQADVVLCLMRVNTDNARRITESLIGKEIVIGPSCRLSWGFNKQEPSVSTQPVITHVKSLGEVPLRRGTRLALCYMEFKRGRTLQQLQMRGVSRGDIRRAIKRGWIKVVGI
jgi:hypothetical protein